MAWLIVYYNSHMYVEIATSNTTLSNPIQIVRYSVRVRWIDLPHLVADLQWSRSTVDTARRSVLTEKLPTITNISTNCWKNLKEFQILHVDTIQNGSWLAIWHSLKKLMYPLLLIFMCWYRINWSQICKINHCK